MIQIRLSKIEKFMFDTVHGFMFRRSDCADFDLFDVLSHRSQSCYLRHPETEICEYTQMFTIISLATVNMLRRN